MPVEPGSAWPIGLQTAAAPAVVLLAFESKSRGCMNVEQAPVDSGRSGPVQPIPYRPTWFRSPLATAPAVVRRFRVQQLGMLGPSGRSDVKKSLQLTACEFRKQTRIYIWAELGPLEPSGRQWSCANRAVVCLAVVTGAGHQGPVNRARGTAPAHRPGRATAVGPALPRPLRRAAVDRGPPGRCGGLGWTEAPKT